jgi:tetratricopeptide (TPR) repeat protein
MSGDLNIAVAGFSTSGSTSDTVDPVVGDGLAQSVFERLPPQLTALETAGFEIQYRAPRDIGQARSGATQERARQLEALARKANADVIISANLNSAPGRTTVIPTLFLRQKKLQGAEELGGYHQLDPVIIDGDPDSNLVMRKKLRDDLISRTGGIARLIVGLGFYNERQYSRAATEIQAAERDWADTIGRKIVHLFLGNIEGKRGNYSAAERNYRLALRTDPTYGRARLGLAALAFQKARGNCERDNASSRGLETTLALYQEVLRNERSSPGADPDLPIKVAFGLGHTDLCLSQAGVADKWTQAQEQLQLVVDEYNRGNQRIQELAAEAYADLGLSYLPAESMPNVQSYQRAAGAYERAVQISFDPHRQAIFLSVLAHIYTHLQDLPRACDAYHRATALDPNHVALEKIDKRRLDRCT